LSALYVGAYSWSYSYGNYDVFCTSSVATTHVLIVSITINNSSFKHSTAVSGECYAIISNAKELTRFEMSEADSDSLGANVSSLAASLPVFVNDTTT